jgi:hypothetical protein
MSLSENGYFGFMQLSTFSKKSSHTACMLRFFFEKLSLPKAKISHFRTGSIPSCLAMARIFFFLLK